jgi:hypothetical protein
MAAARSDMVASGLDQSPTLRAVSMILNAGSVWAGLAVLAGWIAYGRLAGPFAGIVSLWCAVLGYYGWGVLAGDRVDVGISGLSGAVRAWSIAALVLGPLFGLAGTLIRRYDIVGSLALLVVPVGALVEVFVIRRLDRESFAIDPALAWAQAAIVGAALGGIAYAALVEVRRRGLPERT